MKTRICLMTAVMIGAVLSSCNHSGKNQGKVEKTSARTVLEQQKVEKANTEEISNPVRVYQVGDQVPGELVCMVNNAYMGKSQIEVPVDGKIYYGCCEMCVYRLNKEGSSRMAIDPFSGKQVDKSEAYIVLKKANGEVAYFESESNYKSFSKKM